MRTAGQRHIPRPVEDKQTDKTVDHTDGETYTWTSTEVERSTNSSNNIHHVVRCRALQRYHSIKAWSVSVPSTQHYRMKQKRTLTVSHLQGGL